MVNGYNTITLNGFVSAITLEDQKKIVTMFNSNNKPLLARLVQEAEEGFMDLTVLLTRIHYKEGSILNRGYFGDSALLGKIGIRIDPDDSVEFEIIEEA